MNHNLYVNTDNHILRILEFGLRLVLRLSLDVGRAGGKGRILRFRQFSIVRIFEVFPPLSLIHI